MQYRKPPTWLPTDLLEGADTVSVEACAFAKAVAGELEDSGRLTPLDRPAFIAGCVAHGQMAEARRVLRVEGLTVGAGAETKRHPATMVYNSAAQDFQRFTAAFGMTPRAREMAKGNPADAPDRPEHSGEGLLD
jgi:P27 family predicted phage terminase small subunit